MHREEDRNQLEGTVRIHPELSDIIRQVLKQKNEVSEK